MTELPTKLVWYFEPGTERRYWVGVLTHESGARGTVEMPRSDWRWLVKCGACGSIFGLREEHGITVGPDGALTTDHSCNCPKCMNWHVVFAGGVVRPLDRTEAH